MTDLIPGVTTKFTVVADDELCNEIRKSMHHGQTSELFRALLESIGRMIKNGDKKNIMSWLYVGGELTIPIREEHKP